MGGFITLKTIKKYLRKLNNLYRARYKDIEFIKTIIKLTTIRTTINIRLISIIRIITTTPLDIKINLKLRESIYYNCDKKDYYRSIYIITI